MQAHDPLRYIGDILAWVHQAAATEREFMVNLLSRPEKSQENKPESSDSNPPASSAPSQDQYSPAAMGSDFGLPQDPCFDVLNKIFEGLCRYLKVRIEQVVSSHPDSSIYFRLANLAEFYAYTIGKMMKGKRSLSAAELSTIFLSKFLLDMKNEIMKNFYQLLNSLAEKLIQNPPVR